MNLFMKTQIMNMAATTKTFQQSIKMAAMKDDGEIDKEEKKLLDQINKATDEYRKVLEKLSK